MNHLITAIIIRDSIATPYRPTRPKRNHIHICNCNNLITFTCITLSECYVKNLCFAIYIKRSRQLLLLIRQTLISLI